MALKRLKYITYFYHHRNEIKMNRFWSTHVNDDYFGIDEFENSKCSSIVTNNEEVDNSNILIKDRKVFDRYKAESLGDEKVMPMKFGIIRLDKDNKHMSRRSAKQQRKSYLDSVFHSIPKNSSNNTNNKNSANYFDELLINEYNNQNGLFITGKSENSNTECINDCITVPKSTSQPLNVSGKTTPSFSVLDALKRKYVDDKDSDIVTEIFAQDEISRDDFISPENNSTVVGEQTDDDSSFIDTQYFHSNQNLKSILGQIDSEGDANTDSEFAGKHDSSRFSRQSPVNDDLRSNDLVDIIPEPSDSTTDRELLFDSDYNNKVSRELSLNSDPNKSNYRNKMIDTENHDRSSGDETKSSLPRTKTLSNENVYRTSQFSIVRDIDYDVTTNPKPKSAYDVVMKLRAEKMNKPVDPEDKKIFHVPGIGETTDSKGFRVMSNVTYDFYKLPRSEIAEILANSVIYDQFDIVAIDKPYGLPSHGGPGQLASVGQLLKDVSLILDATGKTNLHLIHRLDKETTGAMLLSRTVEMATRLKAAFLEQKVIKKYWVITEHTPSPSEGTIDIPLREIKVGNIYKMTVQPHYNAETRLVMKKSRAKKFEAVTHYRVLDSTFNSSLTECQPEGGKKHQIRVHMAYGMGTPVLGDHKYSHIDKLAPQKLSNVTLQQLGVRQAKVRDIPMHLHAQTIILPEFINGQNIRITCAPPKFFRRTLKRLKLSNPFSYQ